MFRSARTLPLLAFGWIFSISQSAWASDAGETGSKAGAAMGDVIKTISTALEGGEAGAAAQKELIGMAATACLVLSIFVVTYIVASAIGRFFGNQITQRVDVTLGKFSTKAIRNLIMLVVIMVAVQTYGKVDIAGFAAILAALGFAIGMALQGTLSNFAAGIMLLIFRPFKVDDYIVVADTEGTVEEIDLFTTRLNSLDNRHLIIPNGQIFGNKLENYTRNGFRRVDVNVGTEYSADLERTKIALNSVVKRVAAEFPKEGCEAPYVYLMALGASSVDWQLRVWADPSNYWAVREMLTAEAKNTLDAAKIGIPFPQMDVNVGGKLMAKAAA